MVFVRRSISRSILPSALLSWERSIRELAYIHILDPILLKAGVSLENDPSLKNQTLEIHDDQNSQELSKDAKFVD